MKTIIFTVFVIILAGCSTIKHYKHVSKNYGVQYRTTIGHELYRVNKTRDLPNAFGNADIWGGKVNEGVTELRFMGLNSDGKVIFRLTDVDILSNESVFTRYGFAQSFTTNSSTANASIYGNSLYGSSTGSSTTIHIPQARARITKLPPNTVEFLFDPKEKILNLEPISIEIVEAKKHSLSYILHNNKQQ